MALWGFVIQSMIVLSKKLLLIINKSIISLLISKRDEKIYIVFVCFCFIHHIIKF